MAKKVTIIDSNQAQYTPAEFAKFISEITDEGVFNTQGTNSDLKVLQHGVGDMSVDVNLGALTIDFLKNGVYWKVIGENNALENISIPNNGGGTQRMDAIIVKISQDEPNVLKNNLMTIVRINGTSAVALTDFAITTIVGDMNWYRLANIVVNPGDTQILTSQILDTRLVVNIGRNSGGYKTVFRGDGQYLEGLLNSPVNENILPDGDITRDIGAIDYPTPGVNRKFNNVYGKYGRFDYLFGDATGLFNVPAGEGRRENADLGEDMSAGMLSALSEEIINRYLLAQATGGATQETDIYGVNWKAQTFTTGPNTTHISMIAADLVTFNTGATWTLRLTACNQGTGNPIVGTVYFSHARSNSQTSGGLQFLYIPGGVAVTPNTKYALVLSCAGDASNRIMWNYSASSVYAGGERRISADSGATWATTTTDYNFRVYEEQRIEKDGKVYKSDASQGYFKTYKTFGFLLTDGLTGQNRQFQVEGRAVNPYVEFILDDYRPASGATVQLGNNFQKSYGEALDCNLAGGLVIDEVIFKMSKTNSPTGNGYIRIYEVKTGTLGTDARPNNSDTPLYSSGPIDVSLFTVTMTEYTYTFPSPVALTLGKNYCIVFEFTGGNGSNYLNMQVVSPGLNTNGNAVTEATLGTWTGVSGIDAIMRVKVSGRKLIPSVWYAVSDIPGKITPVPKWGTWKKRIGVAVSTDHLMINPDPNIDLLPGSILLIDSPASVSNSGQILGWTLRKSVQVFRQGIVRVNVDWSDGSTGEQTYLRIAVNDKPLPFSKGNQADATSGPWDIQVKAGDYIQVYTGKLAWGGSGTTPTIANFAVRIDTKESGTMIL